MIMDGVDPWLPDQGAQALDKRLWIEQDGAGAMDGVAIDQGRFRVRRILPSLRCLSRSRASGGRAT
jgi:hypothetical protein